MSIVPLADVTTHQDVNFIPVSNFKEFTPLSGSGVSKYRAKLTDDAHLDSMIINKNSDILVVSFHGATNRRKSNLPRFEWMRTLRETEFSSLYFSDPCLETNNRLQLAWYTGWKNFDLYPLIAEWSSRAAEQIGAKKILFLGSSGGGLASLAVSSYVNGSMALPFSAQTSIDNYLVAGSKLTAQRDYLNFVMPHLIPKEGLANLRAGANYFKPLGERTSALVRYSETQQNYVYYVQNENDVVHLQQHYLPFRSIIESGPNKSRVRFRLQPDRDGHHPPSKELFLSALSDAADWLRSTRE